MTIEIGLYNATEYFASLWQLRTLGYYGDPMQSRFGHPQNPEDAAEEGVFRLPPFRGPHDLPLSYTSASSRLHYIALNLLRVDVGNPMFGNVTAIFSPRFRRDAAAAAPIDTGLFTMGCNETYKATPGSHSAPLLAERLDCAEGNITAGVTAPNAMDHVLLNNRIFWARSGGIDTLARAFARTHAVAGAAPAHVTNVTAFELSMYIEPNVLANALYSERAVHLLVGSFAALFGSARGMLLRQWAAARGIALAWAIGGGTPRFDSHHHANLTFAGDLRLVDWPTSSGLLNATASPMDNSTFEQLWDAVAVERARSGGDMSSTTAWRLWAHGCSELSPAIRLALPRPGDCANWEVALGRSAAGDCVAYRD